MENGTASHKSDPTALTTAQLFREIELISAQLDDAKSTAAHELLMTKELLENEQRARNHISTEKFKSIETQLSMIEKQRVEQKSDTKAAVDAALIAQKEAVQEQTIASGLSIAKSEAATAKQLEQLSTTFTTAIQGVTVPLNDLKERVGTMEAVKQGGKEALYAVYTFAAFLVLLIVIGGAIAAMRVLGGES